eukprot:jgi/Astpho2/8318/Aster-x0812
MGFTPLFGPWRQRNYDQPKTLEQASSQPDPAAAKAPQRSGVEAPLQNERSVALLSHARGAASLNSSLKAFHRDASLVEAALPKRACMQTLAQEPLYRTDGVGALLPCTRSPLNYQARLGLPLRCQVTGSRSGKPDLRLRLFTFEAGTVEPSRGQQQWRASEVGQQLQGPLDFASKAAALMFVQTAFQDQAHGFIGAVALLGAATVVGQRALATERGQRLPARLKEGVQHMPDRFKSGAARLKRGVWPAVKRASHLPSEYLPPAATLFLGACAWAWIHPSSFHILQCLAASVPVSAGYAQTARASASGRLAKGPETEEAYRERHRWAAKRVAHLMRDLPATPPLEGAADLADSLQINIGLMVEGQGFPSWPAPDPGAAWAVSGSLPLRSKRARDLAEESPSAPPPASLSTSSGERPAGSGHVGHSTPTGPLQVHADASSTSALPTIRSDAELEAHQHRLRQRAEAGPSTPQDQLVKSRVSIMDSPHEMRGLEIQPTSGLAKQL